MTTSATTPRPLSRTLGLRAAPARRDDPRSSRRVTLALASLALGGVAVGTAEFASMGVLPSVASSLSVSEPTAGLLISAYALGVVIGAPVLAILGARAPRRSLLLA